MPTVPQTPFVPSRLDGGLDDDSMLLAQQPIFEDLSFDEISFWAAPKPGECSRRPHSPTPSKTTSIDVEHSSATVVISPTLVSLADTTITGRGERSTWAEEQSRQEAGLSFKRAAQSPSCSSITRRTRTSSTHVDDYYQRRLSRQSSSSSIRSPSLSSLEISGSTAPSHHRSRQASDIFLEGRHEAGHEEPESSRSGFIREQTSGVTQMSQKQSPPARQTMLTKLLARSSVLQPTSLDRTRPGEEAGPGTSSPMSSSSAAPPSVSRHCAASSSSLPGEMTSSFVESASPDEDAGTSVDPVCPPSLRRSTSQRVLGFFSGLVRSTSSTSSKYSGTGSSQPRLVSAERQEAQLASFGPREGVGRHDDGQDLDHALAEDDSEAGVGPTADDDPHTESSSSTILYRPTPLTNLREPAGFVPLTRPNKAFVSHTASRAGNPIRRPDTVPMRPTRPATSSSFASSALARLPPPGKGASSAGERVTVKPAERAANLQARRALFERPTNATNGASVMSRTIPLAGKTPGKASKARAEERNRFDKAVQSRIADRDRQRQASNKRKQEEADKEYAASRKETVIRANPVPPMYHRSEAERAMPPK